MIYLIKEHWFDSMENAIDSARCIDIKGYSDNPEDAHKYIEKQEIHIHKGWDGEMYPYYSIESVEEI